MLSPSPRTHQNTARRRAADEVGFRPLDCEEANLSFRLVSARYEKGSIVLTSNKHVPDWPEIFAGEILTTVILDRLLHHVRIIHIDGGSYRLREFDGPLAQQPDPSAPAPRVRQSGGLGIHHGVAGGRGAAEQVPA